MMSSVVVESAPQRPGLALVGCGRVAQALALGLQSQGWPIVALASRRPVAAQALARRLGDETLACTPEQAVGRADLVLLTVSDDAIASVVAALPWRSGQGVVHCSGATEVAALDAAEQAGARIGGFHPLQIFSDPELAAQRLAGCSVAIEAADAALLQTLLDLAATLGLRPLSLPAGMRARYHAGAGYAASGLLSVLQEAACLWRSLGIDESAALQALLPLSLGALAAAQARGLGGAVAGPVARADAAVIGRQRADLASLGQDPLRFYDSLAQRQLQLVVAAGRLDAEQRARVAQALSGPPGERPDPDASGI
jgi:predicted short-subunit dehydrogenase-like oxidoreductase (DUF2520 family)